jgi:hypothetical protein
VASEGAQLARRLGCRRSDHRIAQIDPPAAVEELAQLDAFARVTSLARSRRDVDDHAFQAHGVVVEDARLVVEATQALEIRPTPHSAPRRRRIGWTDREASIVISPEGLQYGVGFFHDVNRRGV